MALSSDIPHFQSLPVEVQLSILERLDGSALLAARSSCRLFRDLSDKAMEVFFRQECGSESYVFNGEANRSLRECCLLNIRIALAAKRAWRLSLKPVQLKRLRPPLAHEMGRPRPLCPVKICPIGANAKLLFSNEGCRQQITPLLLKNKSPLTVEVAKEGLSMKVFSHTDFGFVKDAFQGKRYLCLMTETDSSFSLVLEGKSPDQSYRKIELGVKGVVAHALKEGRVLLGTESCDLFDFRFDEEGSLTLEKSFCFLQPVRWIHILGDESVACLSGSTLYLNRAGCDPVEYSLGEEEGVPAVLNNGIALLRPTGDLVFLNASSPLAASTIRREVSSFVPIGENAVLLTASDGVLELRSSDQLLFFGRLPEKERLLAASRQEGLIAAAFSSGEVAVFEESRDCLVKIYSTECFKGKAAVHALSFSKTLELTVTTEDGAIFSIRPFPNEAVSEKEPDSLLDIARRFIPFF